MNNVCMYISSQVDPTGIDIDTVSYVYLCLIGSTCTLFIAQLYCSRHDIINKRREKNEKKKYN
jgi:hypothetical protein